MEDHHLYRTPICALCDNRIEDEPVGYQDPVEIEGLGTAHAFCAEDYLKEARVSSK